MKINKLNVTEKESKNVVDYIFNRQINFDELNYEQKIGLYNLFKSTIASIEKFVIQKNDNEKIIFCVIFIEESKMIKEDSEFLEIDCISYNAEFILLENNELIKLDNDSEIVYFKK